MEKINSIEIRKIENEERTSADHLRIDSCSGDLSWDAYEAGKVSEDFMGKSESEFSYKIEAEWKDTILLFLAKEKFTSSTEFTKWLDEHNIPYRGSSW